MKKITTLDDIRSLTDIKIEPLELPEWGGTVYVRAFDAEAFGIFMNIYAEQKDGAFNMTDAAQVSALCLCDEHGQRIGEREAIAATLLEHSPIALQKIYTKAIEVSELTSDAIEEAEKK